MHPDNSNRPAFRTFVKVDINRISGSRKTRLIRAPNPAMREVHERIKKALRGIDVNLGSATGVKPGSSILGHVKPHRGNQYLVAYDLDSAYSNVNAESLCTILLSRGVDEEIVELVRMYAFVDGGLATGGPASPQLFNLYVAELLDRPMRELLSQRGDITYTRYLDDLLFSSPAPIGKRFRKEILSVIREAGFEHSRSKSMVVDLAENGHIVVNGIGLRVTGEIFVPRGFRRELYTRMRNHSNWDESGAETIAGLMGAFYAIAPPYRSASKSERRIIEMFREFKRTWRTPEQIDKRREKRRRYERNRRRKRKRFA